MLTLYFQGDEEESLQECLERVSNCTCLELVSTDLIYHGIIVVWHKITPNTIICFNIYPSSSTGGMKLNSSSFFTFTVHLKALECFSLSKQVMHTISDECEYAVTWLR